MEKISWIMKYINRVNKAVKKSKVNKEGKIPIAIYTHDLLIESGLTKGIFYAKLFMINSLIDDRIVLGLKGVYEKI